MDMLNFSTKAQEAARMAGQELRNAYGNDHIVDDACDHDIKLRLDRECQELITAHLLQAFPSHSVFGEEGGAPYGSTEFQWIVDPIDGTVNFYYGFPHFCTTLALQYQQKTILGVTYDPVRDELFYADSSGAVTLNGKPIRVSTRTTLADAMISTGFAKSKEIVDESIGHVKQMALGARKVRMNGCAALDMAYVACGRLDAYFERGIRLWDIAAGHLMIENAGGAVKLESRLGTEFAYKMIAWSGNFPAEDSF